MRRVTMVEGLYNFLVKWSRRESREGSRADPGLPLTSFKCRLGALRVNSGREGGHVIQFPAVCPRGKSPPKLNLEIYPSHPPFSLRTLPLGSSQPASFQPYIYIGLPTLLKYNPILCYLPHSYSTGILMNPAATPPRRRGMLRPPWIFLGLSTCCQLQRQQID